MEIEVERQSAASLYPDAWGSLVPLGTHYCNDMRGRHCFMAGCPSANPDLRQSDGDPS